MTTILGILYNNARTKGELFSLETLHFLHLCLLGRSRGLLVYVFGPEGIRSDEQAVWGYIPTEEGVWQRLLCPVPTAVYPRGVSMEPQDEAAGRAAREWLIQQGCQMINSDPLMELAGDKWATYQALVTHPQVAAHLPETFSYDEAALHSLLTHYPTVMLKHRHGFESRGMMRITNRTDGRFDCVHNNQSAERISHAGLAWDELMNVLQGEMAVPEDYILQQGIELARVGGATFELRVIMNKVRDRWLRTGMVIRLSTAAEIPYLAVGYERNLKPSLVFSQVYAADSERVLNQVRELCRLIPPRLERASSSGGELAIDFGFDSQGHPWLIECNSKPFNLFIRTGAFGLRRTNMVRILEYAHYLTKAAQQHV